VRATAHDLRDGASMAARGVSSAAQDAASSLQDDAAAAGEKVSALAGSAQEKASAVWRDHAPEEVSRDTLLLGAAAMAVTAAVGIAYQRRG
jgi:hypothetical protein